VKYDYYDTITGNWLALFGECCNSLMSNRTSSCKLKTADPL